MKPQTLSFGLFIILAAAACARAGTNAKSKIDLTPPERYHSLRPPIGPNPSSFVNDANGIWQCGKGYCTMWPHGVERLHQGK
jgi:hypothetical protein